MCFDAVVKKQSLELKKKECTKLSKNFQPNHGTTQDEILIRSNRPKRWPRTRDKILAHTLTRNMLLALGLARNKLLDHDLVGNKILAQSLAKKKKNDPH